MAVPSTVKLGAMAVCASFIDAGAYDTSFESKLSHGRFGMKKLLLKKSKQLRRSRKTTAPIYNNFKNKYQAEQSIRSARKAAELQLKMQAVLWINRIGANKATWQAYEETFQNRLTKKGFKTILEQDLAKQQQVAKQKQEQEKQQKRVEKLAKQKQQVEAWLQSQDSKRPLSTFAEQIKALHYQGQDATALQQIKIKQFETLKTEHGKATAGEKRKQILQQISTMHNDPTLNEELQQKIGNWMQNQWMKKHKKHVEDGKKYLETCLICKADSKFREWALAEHKKDAKRCEKMQPHLICIPFLTHLGKFLSKIDLAAAKVCQKFAKEWIGQLESDPQLKIKKLQEDIDVAVVAIKKENENRCERAKQVLEIAHENANTKWSDFFRLVHPDKAANEPEPITKILTKIFKEFDLKKRSEKEIRAELLSKFQQQLAQLKQELPKTFKKMQDENKKLQEMRAEKSKLEQQLQHKTKQKKEPLKKQEKKEINELCTTYRGLTKKDKIKVAREFPSVFTWSGLTRNQRTALKGMEKEFAGDFATGENKMLEIQDQLRSFMENLQIQKRRTNSVPQKQSKKKNKFKKRSKSKGGFGHILSEKDKEIYRLYNELVERQLSESRERRRLAKVFRCWTPDEIFLNALNGIY